MPGSCFAERLAELAPISASEHAVLSSLEERERSVRRNATLRREGDEVSEVFLLKRGLLMSYVLLDDGSRQIIDFIFPGELIGLCGLVYNRAVEAVVAVANSVVCPFDRGALRDIFVDHPRLGGLIMAVGQIERVALTDRLAGLGRTSAKARVAALLLELRDRMRRADPTIDGTFPLPLTQEEIGDATGLTAVHVNRMLRQLEDEGLMRREAGRVTILEEHALRQSSSYSDRRDQIDVSWLPPPR